MKSTDEIDSFIDPSIQVWHPQSSLCASVSQVVPRPLVRRQRWEAPGGPRWAWYLPGPRVHVQTRWLCPVGPDTWTEQNWSQEGFSHQDNVSGENSPTPPSPTHAHTFLFNYCRCVTTSAARNSAFMHPSSISGICCVVFKQLCETPTVLLTCPSSSCTTYFLLLFFD